jgi:hypothetical protein
MSTPNPVDPGRKTQREREEEKRRQREIPEQPGTPEIERPDDTPEETEEDWKHPR